MHDDLAVPEWVLVRVLSVRGREELRNDQSHEAANHCYDLAFGDSLRSAGSPHLSVNRKVGSSSLPPGAHDLSQDPSAGRVRPCWPTFTSNPSEDAERQSSGFGSRMTMQWTVRGRFGPGFLALSRWSPSGGFERLADAVGHYGTARSSSTDLSTPATVDGHHCRPPCAVGT